MNAALHLLNLLRARIGRKAHDRRALQKRRLESLLRESGISKAKTRDISWHYFNDESTS